MYAINKLQSNRSIYQVDVLSVNFRLESVIGGNPRDVRVVARSEALLLKTYGADIPNPVGDEVNGEVDSVSVDILKKFQPVVLEDVYPARVAADGNCLYLLFPKSSVEMRHCLYCYVFSHYWKSYHIPCFMIVITRDLWI